MWWDDAINFVGNTFAAATGSLGAVAGGATSFVTGRGWAGVGEGWNAGASFSPVGSYGDTARQTVQRVSGEFDASDAPGWAKLGYTALGPPTSSAQAWGDLAFSAAPAFFKIPGKAAAATVKGGNSMGFLSLFMKPAEKTVGKQLAKTGTRSFSTTGKVLFGVGATAYGYDVLSSVPTNDHGTGGNPFVPDVVEDWWSAAGKTGKVVGKVADNLPLILIGAGAILVLVVASGRRGVAA